MLKRFSPSRVEECLRDAAASPMAAGEVTFPAWYLQRWHFLPEGYLSRRSVAAYDAIVRPLYNAGRDAAVLRKLAREVRREKPERVLDLGCGPGSVLAALATALPGAELTGIDLSPFMLEVARDRLPRGRAELVQGNLAALPWDTSRFDAALAVHVLGHLPAEEGEAALREAARVLKPGGRLFVIDHAWHPRAKVPFRLASEQRMLYGVVRFDVLSVAESN